MSKFAEDDRIEQMNAQKRRMKQIEHKRAVDVLIDERRRQMVVDKVRRRNRKKNSTKKSNIEIFRFYLAT